MNTSRDQLSQEKKDVQSSEGALDLWDRGDLEDLNLRKPDPSSSHVHFKIKMENTIANQNSLIESLQEALQSEKRKCAQLTEEFYSTKEEAAKEIKSLKEKLQEIHSQSKNREESIIKDYKEKLNTCTGELEQKYETHISSLNEQIRLIQSEEQANKSKNAEILEDTLQKRNQRECFLLKQIELLSNRIEELYERGISHDNELDASRKIYEEQLKQMNETIKEMQSSSQAMPEELKTLHEQLAESRTNELTLRAQFNSQNKAQECLIESLENQLKVYSEKFSSLENQYAEMAAERENESKNHSLTMDSYNSTLMEMHKKLKDLFGKISLLLFFLKNPATSDSDSNNSSHLSVDLSFEKSISEIDLFSKINGAISEVEEIKTHIVGLCKDNEELYLENNNLKGNLDKNNQCIESLESELKEVNKKFTEIKSLKIELEEKCIILEKDKTNIQTELNKMNTKCQQLLDDKISLERKAMEFNERYTNQMEVIISQMNNWKTSTSTRPKEIELTPSNESFNINLMRNIQCSNLLNNAATSTPFPHNMCDTLGGGETTNNEATSQMDYTNFAVLKWMEKCHSLTVENGELCNEIENLKSQINELEFSTQIVKEEMDIFEIKRQNLESKISDYEEKKRKIIELKEENIRYLNEIASLKEQIDTLNEKNGKLYEGNIKLEENFQKYILSNACEFGKFDEKFIHDFNERIKEIISLKCDVIRLEESNNVLLKQLDKLNSTKSLCVLKLEQTYEQLCFKEDEMEDLLRDKHQALTENKLLTKEVESLKIQNDRLLKKLRNTYWEKKESPELLEHMQKVILSLSKSLVESKLEINKLKLEKNHNSGVDELDARHRYEILLKNNCTLENEKESMFQKIVELQTLLHEFQQNQGLDSGWLIKLQQREEELLEEMKEHRNQYARIEEALRSTGKLHNELQQQKDELRFKILEISKLEKKLHEEKSNLEKAEIKNYDLLRLLEDKDHQIKTTSQEKHEAENNYKSLHERLIELESKHAALKKISEWRIARADLLLSQNEVDKEVVTLLEQGRTSNNEEIDKNIKFRQDVELSYQKAVNDLKSYFMTEQVSISARIKEEHKQQV